MLTILEQTICGGKAGRISNCVAKFIIEAQKKGGISNMVYASKPVPEDTPP